ncbi:MAG TPA: hypothetical protein P5086_11360 [Prolixibacteraceae bacterium]|jgi:hypothetical protein|nr:hypothetical protein [Prolixibacteraceae bacterium]
MWLFLPFLAVSIGGKELLGNLIADGLASGEMVISLFTLGKNRPIYLGWCLQRQIFGYLPNALGKTEKGSVSRQ